MVVKLNEWNATETTPRPARMISLAVPAGVRGAELRRLTGNGTQAIGASMTWAGTQYTADQPHGVAVAPATEPVAVQGGTAEFQLYASEAALVILQR